MPIIRNRNIEPDDWRLLPDAEIETVATEAGDRKIVPLKHLLERPERYIDGGPLGALLRPEDDVEQLAPLLPALAVIAIQFPAFTEGRGYSQARVLRERYKFSGEIRAVGNVSRDRLAFMERCGINAFVLREGESADAALAHFSEISLNYQPAADGSAGTVRAIRTARAG